MKKLFLLLALCMSLLWSCSDDDDNGGSPQYPVYKYFAAKNTGGFLLEDKYTEVEVEAGVSWIKVQSAQIYDERYYIYEYEVLPNPEPYSRSALVQFKSATKTHIIKVVQAGDFKLGELGEVRTENLEMDKYFDKTPTPIENGTLGFSDGSEPFYFYGHGDDRVYSPIFFRYDRKDSYASGMFVYVRFEYEENTSVAPTIEMAKPHYLNPNYIGFSIGAKSNVNKDNLTVTRNGNQIIYTFKDFRIENNADTYFLMNGKLIFEFDK